MKFLPVWALLGLLFSASPLAGQTNLPTGGGVFILPIREAIMPPLVYLVRRGVKEAMEARAEVLILDMKTDGGRVDITEDIIGILNKFPGKTVTYVNDRAFSAGAFIAVGTQEIYMTPQSVIGAAAPIMMAPGQGPQAMPETVEVKMTSAVRALVRRVAEKNGHNVLVIEAMIDKTQELILDGQVISRKGDILTLTDTEAARQYGEPAKPLLSAGTVASLDALVKQLGFSPGQVTRVQPTGAEKIGSWINTISPILLVIGVIGVYIEFKTPGFGLPGIIGLTAFGFYFLGGYIAGFSGAEWVLVFVFGLVLLILELFLFPGTMVIGIVGGLCMVAAIIMALVDVYPTGPGIPDMPNWNRQAFSEPLRVLSWAILGSIVSILILSRYLPRTGLYRELVSSTASGDATVAAIHVDQAQLLGQTGIAISPLRPGGKARFGDVIRDVVADGEMLPVGQTVKVIGFSGSDPIVKAIS